MTKSKALWLTLLLFTFFGCHKDLELVQLTPKISDAIVKVTTNTAILTFQVDFEGYFQVFLVYSENYGFSASSEVSAKKQGDQYVVTLKDLLPMRKYYFRLEVRNEFSVFPSNTQSFTTLEEVVEPTVPLGAIDGQFSVSDKQKVWFSIGNLKYRAISQQWEFTEPQYEVVGLENQNISETNQGWIDLFGWGSGHNPTLISEDYEEYHPFVDWGVNPISNGGSKPGIWRTLTSDEWSYLMNSRAASTVNGVQNARYAKAKVSGREGVILFPDSYTHPNSVSFPKNINDSKSHFSDNSYTADNWMKMEEEGVVFLPAAGFRTGAVIDESERVGCYWSSSANGDVLANMLLFNNTLLNPNNSDYRYYGQSVRLVCNVN